MYLLFNSSCQANYIRTYMPHLDGRSLSRLKHTKLLKLNIYYLTLAEIKEVERYKEHYSNLVCSHFH